ncbi:protein-tyrosine phosphatase family protein [Limobrevibacterium gyesilva]|uniref:Tyrosine specific protein phosphatases domain-containing protein n=1 Tax=Limobrevibacterium gyesilva TaxID=2991712 RepID=A0AA42CCV1_9PROT|nr:hypothetical protein [Limobrevibacterium gyesilva]MCW3474018.1 hypothetical protein [Limobrevibacterium gyesilva]
MTTSAPNGAVTLRFFGRDRRIAGGPFDSYAPPAIGVCLEAGSAKAPLADLRIDIPDFQPPTEAQLRLGLARLLVLMRQRPDDPVYVGCRAGFGRTGTIIAALAKLAGMPDPVAWTRAQYHPHAVETAAQEQAVRQSDTDAVWRMYDALRTNNEERDA